MSKPVVAFVNDQPGWLSEAAIPHVYGEERLARLRDEAEVHPVVITSANFDQEAPHLERVEAIFSTWGMPKLTESQLDRLPNLKAVFYAAGSVNGFAAPLAARGITICSAVEANAIPVAEFCLAQILLACKGYWRNSQACKRGPWSEKPHLGRGVYGETVALLGIGAISRHLLTLLKPIHLRVVAVSGYLATRPAAEVQALGIDRLVSLEEAFAEGYVISNHLPDKPSNQRVITAAHIATMRPGATFINTGRGAQIDELGMASVLRRRQDLTALLDVQFPEPPVAGSPLYDLPNVHLTGHIAGSAHDEVRRMADFMIAEFIAWREGQPLRHRIAPQELAARA